MGCIVSSIVWKGVSGIGLILWNSVAISIRGNVSRGLIPGFRESKGHSARTDRSTPFLNVQPT